MTALLAELNHDAVDAFDGFAVHAGVVAMDGVAVALPGHSGDGEEHADRGVRPRRLRLRVRRGALHRPGAGSGRSLSQAVEPVAIQLGPPRYDPASPAVRSWTTTRTS